MVNPWKITFQRPQLQQSYPQVVYQQQLYQQQVYQQPLFQPVSHNGFFGPFTMPTIGLYATQTGFYVHTQPQPVLMSQM